MKRLVHGLHPCAELLDHPERAVKLLHGPLGRGVAYLPLVERARDLGIETEEVPRTVLDKLTEGGVHQGIVIRAHGFEFDEEADFWPAVEEGGRAPLVLAFDEVTDPHNFGACLRTLEALGGAGALYMQRRQAQLNGVAEKASAGAVEHLRLCRVVNLSRALETAADRGFRVVGLDMEGAVPLAEFAPGEPTVVVAGAEGHGLRPSVRDACTALARIPLAGRVSSLNVSVAAGIALAWFAGALAPGGGD